MKPHHGIRRLFLDIEVSPDLGFFWGPGYKLNINYQSILKERAIICAAWKWEGDRKIYSAQWNMGNWDDKEVCRQILEVCNEADEIVGHFGDGFDFPWVRTRCLYHNLGPLVKWKTVDTKALSAKGFYFNSNKLDYLSQFFGGKPKLHTEYQLWIDVCWHKIPRALAYMVKYCKGDIDRLEFVYQKLRVASPIKTHVGVVLGGESWSCPHCGSVDVKKNKTRVSATGTVKHQMVCNSCHLTYTISQSAHSKYLESKKQKKK